jgi:hypothetical protein
MFTIGQRSTATDVLVILTDGISDDPKATWQQAIQTRAANISIITVSYSVVPFHCRALTVLRIASGFKHHHLDNKNKNCRCLLLYDDELDKLKAETNTYHQPFFDN